MAVTCVLKYEGESGGDKSKSNEYVIAGTDDYDVAVSTLESTAPGMEGTLVRTDVNVKEIHVEEGNADRCFWLGTATYGETQFPSQQKTIEPGDTVVRFSTKGGSQHVNVSREITGAYGPGSAIADTKNLIGVSPRGVEGADIGIAVFDFTVRKAFTNAGAAPSLTDIYLLGYTVNTAAFSVTDSHTGLTIACDSEEVLFRGAEMGGERTDGAIEMMFDFAARPNETGRIVGDINGIDKQGHELLDVWYRPYEIAGLDLIGQKAHAVYTHRVYSKGDFSKLNL